MKDVHRSEWRKPTTAEVSGFAVAAQSRSAQTRIVVEHQRNLSETFHALWFKPTLAMAGAILLAVALAVWRPAPDSWLLNLAYPGNATDARQLLTVIIGALVPATSLVFALTVVTLQIASTQYSPRLLRTFLRDRGTQAVMSCFVGTISFCVATLFAINTDAGHAANISHLALTVALLLTFLCIGLLVYYIGHITNAVRIDTIMRHVESDTRTVLKRDHPLAADGVDPDAPLELSVPDHAIIVTAAQDGYVQGADPRLLALAERKDVRIQGLQKIGYYVVEGRPLAAVWTTGSQTTRPTTIDAIGRLFAINLERRVEQDFGLGLRQLVDIINRAMSTGQNDPYTATQAIHHLTSLLMDCARRSFGSQVMIGHDGQPRAVLPRMDFATHLKVVCGHVRQGGMERHPRVVAEMLRMLSAIGEVAPSPVRLEAVRREMNIILADTRRMFGCDIDREEIIAAGKAALEALDSRTFDHGAQPVEHFARAAA